MNSQQSDIYRGTKQESLQENKGKEVIMMTEFRTEITKELYSYLKPAYNLMKTESYLYYDYNRDKYYIYFIMTMTN